MFHVTEDPQIKPSLKMLILQTLITLLIFPHQINQDDTQQAFNTQNSFVFGVIMWCKLV